MRHKDVEHYLEGSKTIEEVMDLIQGRVSRFFPFSIGKVFSKSINRLKIY